MVELVTERLLMRHWRPSDREPFAALNADPEAMRYFPGTMTNDQSDDLADRAQAQLEDDGFGWWAVEVLKTGAFIGFTGLKALPAGVPESGGTEVGWRLARAAWGHGYATEAARTAVAYAFTSVGLDEVFSMTAVLNAPSRRVMERIGMSFAREFEHPALEPTSELRRHVLYRLRKGEDRVVGAAS